MDAFRCPETGRNLRWCWQLSQPLGCRTQGSCAGRWERLSILKRTHENRHFLRVKVLETCAHALLGLWVTLRCSSPLSGGGDCVVPDEGDTHEPCAKPSTMHLSRNSQHHVFRWGESSEPYSHGGIKYLLGTQQSVYSHLWFVFFLTDFPQNSMLLL